MFQIGDNLMKKTALFILLVLINFGCSSVKTKNVPLRIMTFNIRLNIASDGINAWPKRKEMVVSMIRFHKVDIFGIQEALFNQVQDLSEELSDYKWIGIGRDDGKKGGEFMAIFYKKDRLENELNSTFWLSETPNIPSRGWDAACNRIVSWGKFRDKLSGKVFFHFNTHFDHRGKLARKNSAILLLEKVNEIGTNFPIVVTGDFNVIPDSEPYQIIINGLENIPDSHLIDGITISNYPHYGPVGTFTGFILENLSEQPIDYIFIKNDIKVILHGTLTDSYYGRLPSDHMPVLSEILIE